MTLKNVVPQILAVELLNHRNCLQQMSFADLQDSTPFWIVRRERLDSFLIEKAINAGAELFRPFEVCLLKKVEK